MFPGLVVFDTFGATLGVLAATLGRTEDAAAHFARAEALDRADRRPAAAGQHEGAPGRPLG